MNKLKFYTQLPDMECLSGDTLDRMDFLVDGLETLNSPTAYVQISKKGQESNVIVNKQCAEMDGGFYTGLNSDDTSSLCGTYWLDFVMFADGLRYKKLRGLLIVLPQKGA